MTGETLLGIRKSLKISRRELGKAVQLSEREIAYLEAGKRKPSVITALRLERYFGKPLELLFAITDEELTVQNYTPDFQKSELA